MKRIVRILLLMASLTTGAVLFAGCSHDDGDVKNTPEPEVKNPVTLAVKELDNSMAGLDFKELEPLGNAVDTPTRGVVDDVSDEVRSLLSKLLSTLKGDMNLKVSGGRRFTYQSMNDALSVSFDLAGSLETNRESDASFLSKYTKGEGVAEFTAKDGSHYSVAGVIVKDVYIQSWKIKVDKASEVTIYKNDELLLKLTASVERDRPVWMPLLIRGNTFVGELTYKNYTVTLGYDRVSTHRRDVTLEYRKGDSTQPLIEMSTELRDDADILNLIKHDVTVEADFTVKAMYGVLQFTGHCSNVNYLVVTGKALMDCMENGAADEESCRQMVDEFNEYLTLKMGMTEVELGDLLMSARYVEEENCWKPALVIDSPMFGGQYVVSDLLKSLGVDLSMFGE